MTGRYWLFCLGLWPDSHFHGTFPNSGVKGGHFCAASEKWDMVLMAFTVLCKTGLHNPQCGVKYRRLKPQREVFINGNRLNASIETRVNMGELIKNVLEWHQQINAPVKFKLYKCHKKYIIFKINCFIWGVNKLKEIYMYESKCTCKSLWMYVIYESNSIVLWLHLSCYVFMAHKMSVLCDHTEAASVIKVSE